MEVVTGAMGSLLPKLGELLMDEYRLQKGVKDGIQFLEREMRSMQAALTKVAQVPWDELDPQVKIWAGDVRELSYDMEDVVDNFLVCIEGSDSTANSHKLKGIMDKMAKLFTKGKSRHEIANAIKEIKDRAEEVAARRDRCKVDDVVANLSSINNVDPRLLALYKDQKEFIGIEGAEVELTKKLADDDVSKKQLKIVSIFGPGGLGKTTLAKAVYDRLQAQYEYKAFVPVGQNPEVKKVLKDILLELGLAAGNVATLDERQLINKLQHLLKNKRYFIVIDDVWDIEAWEIIKCALLDNGCGSRVITTSRILDVARVTGDLFEHKPLSDYFSEELFYTRLFGGKDKCPHDLLTKVANQIVKKCGGVPLAIITIASLLVNRPMEDWSDIYTSIGFGYGDNMRKILSYSYYGLPCYLRPCLLHLSIFREDSLIIKDTMIWKWVAEGFVAEEPGLRLFEIGERYFSELVNKSMIMPIEDPTEHIIYACRVHDMVLDMICLLSNEQNFVTLLDNNGKFSSSRSNARRLAVQRKDAEQHNPLANTSMSKLRSYYGSSMSMTPSLSSFQVLRVLDLEGCQSVRDCYLKHLGRLLHLRYLSLESTAISQLPEDIGNLKFLQILDLRNTEIEELPQSIGLLTKLKRLRVDGAGLYKRVPNWIGNLTALEELYLKATGECSIFVKGLGKLTELRVLIYYLNSDLDECSKEHFVKSIYSLRKIQVIRLHFKWSKLELDTYWKCYDPPPQLRDMLIWGDFSRLPAWINSSLIPNLSNLNVDVDDLEEQDVVNLGRLPELLDLCEGLWIPAGMKFPDGAFPKLRRCNIYAPFRFLQGSMESLESIRIWFPVNVVPTSDFDFIGSLGNLPSLRTVIATINCLGVRASDVEEVEAAVRQAIDTLPNRLTLRFQKHNADKMEKEPDSPLHRTVSVGTASQVIDEEEKEESNSKEIEQKSHQDSEQRNQDQHPHDGDEAEAAGASNSGQADQQPDDEHKAKDGSAQADAAERRSVLDVHPDRSVPRLSVGTSAQVINHDVEEESQADRQEQRPAKDGLAEAAAPKIMRTVDVSSLAESCEAAGTQVPARPTWRQWACFSCIDCGTSSSAPPTS